MARDDLTFQLDAIALVEALLRDDGGAYDAVLYADNSPARLREVVAGAIGGWASVLDNAYGPDALAVLSNVRAHLLAIHMGVDESAK